MTKFSWNAAISGGPSVTNHFSPLVMLKYSRSDGYGTLSLALGHSHDLPFHLLVAQGHNLVLSPQDLDLLSQSITGAIAEDRRSPTI